MLIALKLVLRFVPFGEVVTIAPPPVAEPVVIMVAFATGGAVMSAAAPSVIAEAPSNRAERTADFFAMGSMSLYPQLGRNGPVTLAPGQRAPGAVTPEQHQAEDALPRQSVRINLHKN